jgi:hypothetical protein
MKGLAIATIIIMSLGVIYCAYDFLSSGLGLLAAIFAVGFYTVPLILAVKVLNHGYVR